LRNAKNKRKRNRVFGRGGTNKKEPPIWRTPEPVGGEKRPITYEENEGRENDQSSKKERETRETGWDLPIQTPIQFYERTEPKGGKKDRGGGTKRPKTRPSTGADSKMPEKGGKGPLSEKGLGKKKDKGGGVS